MARQVRPQSAQARSLERETLILLLDYAVSAEWILENPARKVPRRKQPKALDGAASMAQRIRDDVDGKAEGIIADDALGVSI